MRTATRACQARAWHIFHLNKRHFITRWNTKGGKNTHTKSSKGKKSGNGDERAKKVGAQSVLWLRMRDEDIFCHLAAALFIAHTRTDTRPYPFRVFFHFFTHFIALFPAEFTFFFRARHRVTRKGVSVLNISLCVCVGGWCKFLNGSASPYIIERMKAGLHNHVYAIRVRNAWCLNLNNFSRCILWMF